MCNAQCPPHHPRGRTPHKTSGELEGPPNAPLSSGSIRPGLESWDRELVHVLKIEILIGIIVDLHAFVVNHRGIPCTLCPGLPNGNIL